MNLKISLLLVVYFCKGCAGVIYYLNDTEYDKMPPVYDMDDYKGCLQQPDALYCTIQFDLISDTPSDLLDMIKEYSDRPTHFNHTHLRYSICMSATPNSNCQQYRVNTSEVSAAHLEGCLNKSIWNQYGLRTRVSNYDCHGLSDKSIDIEATDIILLCVLLAIFIANFVGTVNDIRSPCGSIKGSPLLSCFAVNRNFKKLIWNTDNLEPRLQRFKGIHCIRCVILAAVILTHCIWPLLLIAKNVRSLELVYYSIPQYILLSGSTVLQGYLVLSTFLLVYKIEPIIKNVNWTAIPIGILVRYVRLTPVYAVVLGLSATWLKFIEGGPLWSVSGAKEITDCRDKFWAHLFYYHNYLYNGQCMIHSWYLAVDTQLYCFTLVVYVALKHTNRKKIILTTLFIISVLIPAIITYCYDLDATYMTYPEQTKLLYGTDPTFNEVYIRGHTNLASCVTGMALGYLVYRWQESNIYVNKYKNTLCRLIYWTVVPLMILVIMSGGVFYRDAPRDPLYLRVLYGTLAKPLMGVLMAVFICGMIFKIENVYRKILELNIWVIPSRLSYCMFVVHFSFYEIYVSLTTGLKTLGPFDPLILFAYAYSASVLTAIPLWLFIEAPFTELTKYLLHKFIGAGENKPAV